MDEIPIVTVNLSDFASLWNVKSEAGQKKADFEKFKKEFQSSYAYLNEFWEAIVFPNLKFLNSYSRQAIKAVLELFAQKESPSVFEGDRETKSIYWPLKDSVTLGQHSIGVATRISELVLQQPRIKPGFWSASVISGLYHDIGKHPNIRIMIDVVKDDGGHLKKSVRYIEELCRKTSLTGDQLLDESVVQAIKLHAKFGKHLEECEGILELLQDANEQQKKADLKAFDKAALQMHLAENKESPPPSLISVPSQEPVVSNSDSGPQNLEQPPSPPPEPQEFAELDNNTEVLQSDVPDAAQPSDQKSFDSQEDLFRRDLTEDLFIKKISSSLEEDNTDPKFFIELSRGLVFCQDFFIFQQVNRWRREDYNLVPFKTVNDCIDYMSNFVCSEKLKLDEVQIFFKGKKKESGGKKPKPIKKQYVTFSTEYLLNEDIWVRIQKIYDNEGCCTFNGNDVSKIKIMSEIET